MHNLVFEEFYLQMYSHPLTSEIPTVFPSQHPCWPIAVCGIPAALCPVVSVIHGSSLLNSFPAHYVPNGKRQNLC